MATKTWTGGNATDAKWSRSDNWSPSGSPSAGDDLVFAGSTRPITNNDLLADTSFASITFTTGASGFTLNGNRITLAGDITVNATASCIINFDMILTSGNHNIILTKYLYMNGIVSGASGSLTVSSGTLQVLNIPDINNTYGGGTIVKTNAAVRIDPTGGNNPLGTGDIYINEYSSFLWLDTGTLALNLHIGNGGAVQMGAGGSATLSGTIVLAGDGYIIPFGANTYQITGNISGTGNIIYEPSAGASLGSITVSGNNSYSGGTVIDYAGTGGGTVKAGSLTAFGSNSAMNIMINQANVSFDLNGYDISIGSLTGGGTTGGNVILGSKTLTVGGDNTSPPAFAGVISGSGGKLSKVGSGTLSITTAPTYTGATTISGTGTLKFYIGSWGTPSFDIGSGSVFEINTDNATIYTPSAATFTGTGTLRFAGATWIDFYNSGAIVYSLSNGALVDVQCDYEGGFDENFTNNHSDLNVTSGKEFRSNWGSPIFNKITGGGNIEAGYDGSEIFTFGIDGGSSTFSGHLVEWGDGTPGLFHKAGAGTITISGTIGNGIGSDNVFITVNSGTLILTAANTYIGTTTVNGGTLLVNGSIAGGGAITIASAATLGGIGSVDGAISVSSGGTLAPGNGSPNIGTLSTADVTFNSGAIYLIDLNGTNPTYDQINSSGTITCAGNLTINSITTPITKRAYTIANANTVTSIFSGLSSGTLFFQQSRKFKILYSLTQIILTDISMQDLFSFTNSDTLLPTFWAISS